MFVAIVARTVDIFLVCLVPLCTTIFIISYIFCRLIKIKTFLKHRLLIIRRYKLKSSFGQFRKSIFALES